MASEVAHRRFYDFDQSSKIKNYNSSDENNKETFFKYINDNVIGSHNGFSSPFGQRRVTYCDYIASGRSLKFIEDYILEQVLPQYGSTHTTTSVTSLQTTLFRHEARDIVRNAVRASEHDRIIFTGSGATGAINKLIHGLKMISPPVVFVDFTAHHSSLLPWREIGAVVIRVAEKEDGSLNLSHLESLLKENTKSDHQMIGCFSAASNITGLVLDITAITVLLHQYGALSFWDYATAAPYIDITMNPVLTDDSSSLAHKDAIYFSLHKFIGGVQTPGVLIAKKFLFKNSVPSECGGGTVFFVSRESHRYLKDVEEREEGGTPPIVETIRGGLVMQLKMSLTAATIQERCLELSRKLKDFVSSVPELLALGNLDAEFRLPILSFNVKHPLSGKYLHYNYVSAILNDVFGVQSRGGCACAGPFAQDLLGIDEALAQRYEKLLLENPDLDRSHLRRKEEHSNLEILRPGFVRINLPYTATGEQINFILTAIKITCTDGWKLLPQYIFNPETGEWKHHTNLVFKSRQWLQNINYSKGYFEANLCGGPSDVPSYDQMLKDSERIFEEALKIGTRRNIPDQHILFQGDADELCWFLHPFDAQQFLKDELNNKHDTYIAPFTPVIYPLSIDVINSRSEYIWSRRTVETLNTSISELLTKVKELSIHNASDINNTECSNSSINVEDVTISNVKDVTINNAKDVTISNVEDVTISNLINNSCTEHDKISYNKINVDDKIALQCVNGSCVKRNNVQVPSVVVNSTPKSRWVAPPKVIFNPTVEALETFSMIRPNDKVLVCLSGGKDSLSLLHTLHQYQFYGKSKGIPFSLGAVTVDPLSSSYDPTPLIPYLKMLDVPYLYEEQDILKQAVEMESLNSICSFCSRLKRGRIYAAARREGYNVLALGQHLDDMTESFLMSVFHNGRLRTMKASYRVREGDLRVIRPFVYVREKELRKFAESKKLPIIPENCPGCFESPKERHRVKQLLAQQEVLFPNLFWSLKTALLPLFSIGRTGIENSLFGKKCILNTEDEEEEIGD